MNELSHLCGSERYGACDDEAHQRADTPRRPGQERDREQRHHLHTETMNPGSTAIRPDYRTVSFLE